MGFQVVMGASLQCSFGAAPGSLMVLPAARVMAGSMPAATIMDNKPMVNILPFGMCSSIANPMVSAATAAALGVLTPMPCIPNIVAPWTPTAPTIMIGGKPVLEKGAVCLCLWAGVIKINAPGQGTVKDM